MKKVSLILSIILALTLCLTSLVACNEDDNTVISGETGGEIGGETDDALNNGTQSNGNNSTPPADELKTFQKPFHPCMQFSYPKYASDTGYSINGNHNDELYVDDLASESIAELLAMDTEALKATLIAEHSVNNLRDYTITDLSASTRTNAKGVSVFTYEFEATVGDYTTYVCFYAFEGIEEGWVLCYTCTKDKSQSDQTLLETVFNTIEILEATDEY